MYNHPYGRKRRKTKEPVDENERGEWRSWLKLNIQKTMIMASCPITSWQIDGETVQNSADLIFEGLQNHCALWLQPWNKKTPTDWKNSYDQPRQHIKKQRYYLAMVFPVVMYGCESWTIKKAEHQRIDDFELWCWRRILRVPWTARKLNQSILKESSPQYSLEGLKLKLQYFGLLMRRTDSLEKTDAGKDWRPEEKGTTEDEMVGWHHWLDGHEFE